MRRRAGLAAATVVVLLAPAVAFAAERHESAPSFFWHLLNLLLLLVVLVYFARSPLRTFFGERRQTITEGIDEARQELAAAEERLAGCRARADALDAELDAIRRTVRQQAESERDRLLAEARQTAERIRRDATAAAEQEVRRAREALREEVVDLSVKIAGGLLHARVDEGDRTRLVDDFVRRVESRPGDGARG
jgi:F-type H+-transporting ATPase subunit b